MLPVIVHCAFVSHGLQFRACRHNNATMISLNLSVKGITLRISCKLFVRQLSRIEVPLVGKSTNAVRPQVTLNVLNLLIQYISLFFKLPSASL